MTIDFDVTLRTLQLGSQDSTTGWYAKSYSTSTIEMLIATKATAPFLLSPGGYVRLDALGRTQDVVYIGDQIKDASDDYYEVEAIRPHYLGDSFWFRECDLTLLPFQGLTGGTYTPSTVVDARSRIKVLLDGELSGTALPNFIVAYGEPDYPMVSVFNTKGVDLVYSIGEPTSTPLLDSNTQAPYGYEEKVPVTHWCIDKSNITGTKLKWQAETELRRVIKENPTGSIRQFERRRNVDRRLGSTILYGTEWVITYRRDPT